MWARAQIALVVSFSRPTSPRSFPAAATSFSYVSRGFPDAGASRGDCLAATIAVRLTLLAVLFAFGFTTAIASAHSMEKVSATPAGWQSPKLLGPIRAFKRRLVELAAASTTRTAAWRVPANRKY